MSAPSQHDDPSAPSFYAPRWARESGTNEQTRPAERMDSVPPWRQESRRSLAKATQLADDFVKATRMPEDPRERSEMLPEVGSNVELAPRRSTVPWPSLEPELLAPPPRDHRHSAIAIFVRLIVAVVLAAMVALIIVVAIPVWQGQKSEIDDLGVSVRLASLWSQVGSVLSRVQSQPVRTAPRLVVQDAQGNVNEPLAFNVAIDRAAKGAALRIAGLPPGAQLSAGRPLGTNGWRIAVSDLTDAIILPPRNFVGAVDLTVDLRLADDTVADSRALRFEWAAPQTPPQPQLASLPPQPAPAPPSRQAAPEPSPAVKAPPQIDPEELATLLKRGEELVAHGDLASARLLLQRAADARDARAAFALAMTYDPAVLKQLGVFGFQPDLAKARAWYEKAAELGSVEASQRLERLPR